MAIRKGTKYIFLFFCVLPLIGNTQEVLHHKINHSNGLPANTVYRIIQDQKGYIWMATDQGVIRYNGSSFLQFTRSDGLSDNDVVMLKEAKDGKIWFFGYNGTACYWFNGKIYNEKTDSRLKTVKTNYTFIDLYEDHLNRKWFFSISGSILLDSNYHRVFKDRIPGCSMYYGFSDTLIFFRYNTLWHTLYSKNKVSRYSPIYAGRREGFPYRTKDGQFLFFSNKYLIAQNHLEQKILLNLDENQRKSKSLSLCITKDDQLWIATQFGLYCYQKSNLHLPPKIYFPGTSFTLIFTDKEDNIWVSTPGNGIIQIPATTRKINYFNAQKGDENLTYYAINKLANGNTAIGLDRGRWINWDPNANLYSIYGKQSKSSEFSQFMVAKDKDVWVGLSTEMTHYNLQTLGEHNVPFTKGENTPTVVSVIKSFSFRQGKYYIAAKHSLFEYFPAQSNKNITIQKHNSKTACNCYGKEICRTNIKIYSIHYSNQKQLWVGTDSGLYVFKNGSIKRLPQTNELLKERINCIAETNDSSLLIGTHGNGLFVFKNGKVIQHFQMKYGSGSNFSKKICVTGPMVYLLTFNGLYLFKNINGKLEEQPQSALFSPFQKKEINDIYVSGNEIGLAGNQSVYIIKKQLIEIENPIPNTYIEEISMGDSTIYPNQESRLPYKKNNLKIKFITLHFQNPERVNYRYRLSQTQDWFYTNDPLVDLQSIESGNYQFEVSGRIGQEKWSKPAVFKFMVALPFWRETWFILICSLAIAILSAFFVQGYSQLKLKKKVAAAKLNLRINELEQQALLTMMNPHFIFNVMNSIQAFINSDNPKFANQYLSDFAKLIRFNLDLSHKKHITLEEEITYLKLYIHFESIRLQKTINFEIEMDSNLEQEEDQIPAMLLQPFIENAIWHGLHATIENPWIHLHFTITNAQTLQIEIKDNGIGVPEKLINPAYLEQTQKAHGLSITIQRICLLNQTSNAKGLIEFSHLYPNEINKGTCVRINLPR